MNLRSFLTLTSLITSAAFAAELPKIPSKSIATKKEILFSDDFESAAPAKVWHKVVATFAVENGTLKGTQTRVTNIPAADGKPAITAHAASTAAAFSAKSISLPAYKIALDAFTNKPQSLFMPYFATSAKLPP